LFALPVFAGMPTFRLKVGAGTPGTINGGISAVPLLLDNPDSEIQGLQMIMEWNGANGTGVSIVTGAAIADADVVAMRIESDHALLGVVMDNDGAGGEVIDPGSDQDVGTLNIECDDAAGVFPVSLVDQKYAMVGNEPLLDNLLVEGGLSIGATEGLELVDGSFECEIVPDQLCIESGGNPPTDEQPDGGQPCGAIRVLMTNSFPVEGFVTAICHDDAVIELTGISMGTAATGNGADYSATDISSTGGVLGVVLDLLSPFDGNTIPDGGNQHIATYLYCCQDQDPDDPQVCTPLAFCDDTLGSPVKDNVIVVGGLSIGEEEGLILKDGEFCCNPPPPPTGREICGNGLDDDGDGLTDAPDCPEDCDDGRDNDGDGLIDLADPACQQMFACGGPLDENGMPTPLEGGLGMTVDVCFFIKSPEDNASGHAQFDHIQGFSMALTFCCELIADDTFDITGTIVEAIGAEFVTAQADNDPNDGDGCELIIGVLVDALPPFDGATIPPLPDFQLVGCVTFTVRDDATCGSCCPIEFTDGVNGNGKVPVKNLISVENVSRTPQLMDCEVCIVDMERFFRGDCNFSQMGMGMAVDISDAAAVVSYLFLPGTWKFNPPCLDACDCNDDGRIDLADAICILQYYLQNGRFPPLPGPGLEITDDPNPNMVRPTPPGKDPTPDKLDCEAGDECVDVGM
jgi:hypothetical protein